jgi:hypothetical protein
MDANLDKVAKDLYGKIQTRFRDIEIGDENANVLSKKEDIPKARFFEFEYEENGEPLGTIAITLDSQDGIVLQVSGDLVNDDNNVSGKGAYQFIRGFRQFAKDRLLNFDVQNIGKSNLDKRDYQFQAKRKEEPVMSQAPIMENKLYGNARMSYQDLGEARLIIKHSQPVNTELAAGRTLHIDSIYIENAQGERFRYPSRHINGARALAEHIKHGGNPYDTIGKHICSLSEELASLRKFKGYVSRQAQLSEAMEGVTSRVLERIDQIKETIHKLQRPAYYESFVESFEEQEEQMIPEEIQNDLIDRLTVRTFNEELKAVFPYIYKFVDESELQVLEIGADDLLDEVFAGDKEEGTTHKGGKVTKKDGVTRHEKTDYEDGNGEPGRKPSTDGPKSRYHHTPILDPEDQFESFMDDIIREDKDELFSPIPGARNRAITKFNTQLASELTGGDMGVMSLKGILDDPEIIEKVRVLDSDDEIRQAIKDYILDKNPEILPLLTNMDTTPQPVGGETPAEPEPAEPAPVEPAATEPAPVEPAATEPVPAAPVAEAKDTVEKDADGNVKSWKHEGDWKKSTEKKDPRGKVTNSSGQALKKTIAMAKKAGATLETVLDFGYKEMTLGEALEGCGMTPQDAGFDEPQEIGLPSMLKYISGFYNKDEGNFPLGGQRIKIKVKKAFEDGEFGQANPADLMKVIKFIDSKDPSGNDHNQIMRLAGVNNTQAQADESTSSFDISTLETQLQGMSLKFGGMNESTSELDSIVALTNKLRGK